MPDTEQLTSEPDTCRDPIFILGIMHRSGTNYLEKLLRLHPDCDSGGPVWEDYLVAHSHLIVNYARSVYNTWDPGWGIEEVTGSADEFCKYVGDGLLSFLAVPIMRRERDKLSPAPAAASPSIEALPKRLLTKTPSVRNIQNFFKLFPQARLLIIIRDGRAITESLVKSFDRDYENAMRSWARNAQTVLEFDRNFQNSNHQYLIVKYEDIYTDNETELAKILSFLELDPRKYDFTAAKNLSIKGSSELRSQGDGELHWRSVEKTPDFNPLLRWQHWRHFRHERFNWLAGDYLVKFGYAKQAYSRHQWLWNFINILLDIKWQMQKLFRRKVLPHVSFLDSNQ